MIPKSLKISVVMPAYNSDKYISESIQSVLNQTFTDFELIIINDGSTDKTAQIIKKYTKQDKRIVFIDNKKNTGVVNVKNTAVSHAKSDYIYTLDSDDIIDKNTLQELYDAMIDGYGDVITCRVKKFGEQDGELKLPKINKINMSCQNCLVNSALFKKTDFIQSGGYDDKCKIGLEDYDLWLNFMFNLNKHFYRINKILFYYRIKPVKESRNISSAEKHRKIKEYFKTKYPKIKIYRKLYKIKRFPRKIFGIFLKIQKNKIKIFNIPIYKK